jgi:predicted GNAT superfamily acetyltransferase
VHYLSPLTAERLAELHAASVYHRVAALDGAIAGFLLALSQGRQYDSPNYLWFSKKFARFLYIDRVVVCAQHRSHGVGSLLYDDVFAFAKRSEQQRVVCEFDIDPPNEASQRFHSRFGFKEVGSQTVGHGKRVSLQAVTLPEAKPLLPAHLRPDCAACCGLCCVAPAFDAGQGFGFDKPAHTPCLHLTAACRCAIYDRLADKGFPGCVVFDCYGAGQWITQHLFKGASWQDSPQVAQQMFEAYTRLRPLRELMAMLTLAIVRTDAGNTELKAKLNELETLCAATPETIMLADVRSIRQSTLLILRNAFS